MAGVDMKSALACSAKHVGMLFLRGLAVLFHWPTAIAISWVWWSHSSIIVDDDSISASKLTAELVLFDVVQRFVRMIALLLHEVAHLVVASILIHQPCYGSTINMGGSGLSVLWQFVPGTVAPSTCFQLGKTSSDRLAKLGSTGEMMVRLAGPMMSAMLPFIVYCVALPLHIAFLPVWSGLILGSIGAAISDLPCGPLFGPLPPFGCFCCGNWGLIAVREGIGPVAGQAKSCSALWPHVCEEILVRVIDIVELRGAQAGGLITYAQAANGDVTCIRARQVKSKRGNLGDMMFRKFRGAVRSSSLRSALKMNRLTGLPVVLAQGHSRFGTSSKPAEIETHPHQWLGPHSDVVWRNDQANGQWRREVTNVCITITHNGDFDAFELYGNMVPNGQLGEWLGRVLHKPHFGKGDSAKMAGIMDLLIAQGRWRAAVRLAFVEVVLQHHEEVCGWHELNPGDPNVVPTPKEFEYVARIFDSTFEKAIMRTPDFLKTKGAVESLASTIAQVLTKEGEAAVLVGADCEKNAKKLLESWAVSGPVLQAYCKRAVHSFFDNDVFTAISHFFRYAEGTFAISCSCSLDPNNIVIAAKGQPLSITFDQRRPIAIWASEPRSLQLSWPGMAREWAGKARFDLADATGEAIEMKMLPSKAAERLVKKGYSPGVKDAKHFMPPHDEASMRQPYRLVLRGTSLGHHHKPLAEEAFRKRWVRLTGPPPPPPLPLQPFFQKIPTSLTWWLPTSVILASPDPISRDIQTIPSTLAEVNDSWTDRTSLNWQSGVKFSNCIARLLRDRENGIGADGIDVLVLGIENSLWLGQQFAADLARVYPRLKVTAMSSNWVLGMMQKAQGHVMPTNFALSRRNFKFSPHGMVLSISQSGTTYPTVWATRNLTQLPLCIFAMSGEFDTVLANSIGQDLTKPEFAGALFSTMSGVRPNEPSTTATLAMHHTLTWLLLFTTERLLTSGAIQERGYQKKDLIIDRTNPTPACELRLHPLRQLKDMAVNVIDVAEQISGVTRHGTLVASSTRDGLLDMGAYLSSALMEGWFSTILSAAYVYITVTVGVPLLSTIWLHVEDAIELDEDEPLSIALHYVFAHLDAWIYVFLGAILSSIHRLLTGRRLWTRYTGRGLVIVDCTMNYKLLRAYTSKLKSLAYRFQSFGVSGQNPQDHFVHEMTHLTQSEGIVIVGRPDGRLGSLAAAEAATIMSTQQARFIASRPCAGVECMGIGHNPWVKPTLFARHVTIPVDNRPPFLSSQLLSTAEGGHAPGGVMSAVAALAEGGGGDAGAISKDAPVVTMQQLADKMDNAPAIPVEEATSIMLGLLRDQEERLDIVVDRLDFHAMITGGRAYANYQGKAPSKAAASSAPAGPSFGKDPKAGFAKDGRTQSTTSLGGVFAMAGKRPSQANLTTNADKAAKAEDARSGFAKSGRANSTTSLGSRALGRGRAALLGAMGKSAGDDPDAPKLITAATIMSVLRGTEIKIAIKKQRLTEKKEKIDDSYLLEAETMAACFSSWAKIFEMKTEQAAAAPKKDNARKETLGPADEPMDFCFAEWRAAEEFRASIRRKVSSAKPNTITVKNAFEYWRRVALIQREEEGRPPPTHYDSSAIVGADLIGKVKGQALIAELAVIEQLYETRIAAMERLMGFYVVFHRAVKPVSRMPILSFDMDRSESRLRVASTPAPIPFVEELARGSPASLKALEELDSFELVIPDIGDSQLTPPADLAALPRESTPPDFPVASI